MRHAARLTNTQLTCMHLVVVHICYKHITCKQAATAAAKLCCPCRSPLPVRAALLS
jgi:hypothetical protein